MGFITEYDPRTHRSEYALFTPEECHAISKILLRHEKSVLAIPNEDGQHNKYEGITRQFSVYNWLDNPDMLIYDIPKRLFTLPEFQSEEVLYVQCWANILRQGEKLQYHTHAGDENTPEEQAFYASNTFIAGPEDTGTYYNDAYERNTIGHMHLIGSMVPHEVKSHMYREPRISMAMDIYHDNHPTIRKAIQDINTNFISSMTVQRRIKRITNRYKGR